MTITMSWDSLVFGTYSRESIQKAVADPQWQDLRTLLVGTSLQTKYIGLVDWLQDSEYSTMSKIQVTNYVNALKRGGLI